ncbi:MAG: MATE family efflux transporter [Salinivirgaceae bacterium]|nr:MATE family efflux transporter [Salinivirgaceae bacterium]
MNTAKTYSFKNIWKIAFPIILGSIAQDLITIVDTAFVGRLGETELGAVAIGSIFYLAIVMLGWGFGLGVQIIIARRFGENNIESINKTLLHSFVVLIILAIVVVGIVKAFNPYFLDFMISSEAIKSQSQDFLNIRIWGLFAAFINITFRAFYIGTSNTKIIGYTTILMALVNVTFDYLLIFGIGNFPELLIKGAAIASVIAEYCALIFFFVYTLLNKKVKKFNLFKREKFDKSLLKKIFVIASPTTLQNFISFSAWFLFFIFVEKMGEIPLAVSNIIRSIYIIMILPIMGFASATNTLVSYSMGRNETKYVPEIIKKTLLLSGIGIFSLTTICLIFPIQIIGFFTNIPDIINATLPVFYVVMVAAYTLGFGFIMYQAVSGTGNTITSLFLEITIITIYMLGVFYISKKPNALIQHVWIMEIVYGMLLGTFSLLYLKYGNWKNKKI